MRLGLGSRKDITHLVDPGGDRRRAVILETERTDAVETQAIESGKYQAAIVPRAIRNYGRSNRKALSPVDVEELDAVGGQGSLGHAPYP